MLWPSNWEIASIWQFTGSHRGAQRGAWIKYHNQRCHPHAVAFEHSLEGNLLNFYIFDSVALETWYLLSELYQHVQTFQFSFFACKPLPLPKCQQYEWTLVNFCSFGFALLNVQCASSMCKRTFVKSANLGWTFGQPTHLVLTPLVFFSVRAFGNGHLW